MFGTTPVIDGNGDVRQRPSKNKSIANRYADLTYATQLALKMSWVGDMRNMGRIVALAPGVIEELMKRPLSEGPIFDEVSVSVITSALVPRAIDGIKAHSDASIKYASEVENYSGKLQKYEDELNTQSEVEKDPYAPKRPEPIKPQSPSEPAKPRTQEILEKARDVYVHYLRYHASEGGPSRPWVLKAMDPWHMNRDELTRNQDKYVEVMSAGLNIEDTGDDDMNLRAAAYRTAVIYAAGTHYAADLKKRQEEDLDRFKFILDLTFGGLKGGVSAVGSLAPGASTPAGIVGSGIELIGTVVKYAVEHSETLQPKDLAPAVVMNMRDNVLLPAAQGERVPCMINKNLSFPSNEVEMEELILRQEIGSRFAARTLDTYAMLVGGGLMPNEVHRYYENSDEFKSLSREMMKRKAQAKPTTEPKKNANRVINVPATIAASRGNVATDGPSEKSAGTSSKASIVGDASTGSDSSDG